MSYTLTPLTAGPQNTNSPLSTSSNGVVVVQCVYNDGVYVSTNSGTSWTKQLSDALIQWSDSTVTANGSRIAVTSDNNDSLVYVSTNSGANWTPRTFVSGNSYRVAYTRDGTQLFASNGSHVYRSTDDGANWTQITVSSPGVLVGLAVSDDGTKVIAQRNGNGVAVGTFTTSWSWTNYLSGVGAPQYTCAISGDGTKMALASSPMQYSTDSGANWTTVTGAIASDTTADVAIAQDGSRFTAFSATTVYTATDPASTWSSQAQSFMAGFIAGSSTLGIIYITRSGGRNILRGELPAPPPIICFRDGSKILTFNPATGREEYTAVENIRPGTLVKTRMSGYVPVCMVGASTVTIPNDAERTADRLYVCSKDQFPELTEDLYITGHHSILVNNMTDAEREECAEEMGRVYMTEGRCRLPAHISRRTRVYEAPGAVERIWHFALENNDEQMNYGVYANGLLVESCSIWRLRTMVGYELMMGNVYTLSNTVSAPPARLPIVC